MRLEGRVVAVAGAGGGLGPAVVDGLVAEGARVATADRSRGIDLLDLAAVRAWREAIVTEHGHVDGVLHLVGGWRGGEGLGEDALGHWRELAGPLVRTVQHTSLAFLDDLRAAGERGRFAIVSQQGAQRPRAGNAAYASAKAAAEAWTLALADELKGSGATANIVVVNVIGTAKPSFSPPDSVAEALVFLCSDAAQKMNGQRLSLHAA